MSVKTMIFVALPYDFTTVTKDNGKELYVSKIVAVLNMDDLRHLGDTYDKFLRCFSEETPFAIYYTYCDVTLDNKEVWADICEDAYGKRMCYAPDTDELLSCVREMKALDDDYRINALIGLLESFKDRNELKFTLYQY